MLSGFLLNERLQQDLGHWKGEEVVYVFPCFPPRHNAVWQCLSSSIESHSFYHLILSYRYSHSCLSCSGARDGLARPSYWFNSIYTVRNSFFIKLSLIAPFEWAICLQDPEWYSEEEMTHSPTTPTNPIANRPFLIFKFSSFYESLPSKLGSRLVSFINHSKAVTWL